MSSGFLIESTASSVESWRKLAQLRVWSQYDYLQNRVLEVETGDATQTKMLWKVY